MRYQFTLSEPRRHYEWLGLIPLLAVIVAMVIAAACGDKTPPRADASESAVGPTATATTPSAGSTVVGPVTFERAESVYHERRFDDAVALFRAYTETSRRIRGASTWSAWRRGSRAIAPAPQPRSDARWTSTPRT